MANLDTYRSKDIIKNYSAQKHLYKHEQTILNLFSEKFERMSMLDVGVGGGRTAYNFAPLVHEYVGIDYSKEMIEACKKRFSAYKATFKLCDVRDMHIFKDDYFDFILISANGLDYISHFDRIKALNEIKRVGKKNGHLFFSSHNLLSVNRLLEIEFSLNPITIARNLTRYILLRLLNKNFSYIKKQEYMIINDGAHQFRLSTYYIKPIAQIKQLEKIGFKNIHVYSLDNGKEIPKSNLLTTTDGLYHGLYYLCNI